MDPSENKALRVNRRQFFELIDAGGEGFDELVIEASATVRRPEPIAS